MIIFWLALLYTFTLGCYGAINISFDVSYVNASPDVVQERSVIGVNSISFVDYESKEA